ncbi:PLAT/LH2 domain-containing protein [Streptomyces sp. HUAS 31]|uniref:PLAT/LH2 domain-containing protein n=1 Tax=Streptomyces TaxID=1883 RepID=UPI002306087C|nr:PLAT/LH2 domain-containing protein [Streptomyces sp. HUAS 31]WCD99818.1 PLAT/LH2 domain-containing protein [Streptomyces sp. HUAS 31]
MPATNYRVTTVTGSADYAGTDANVYITLYGQDPQGQPMNSGERLLDNSEDNFEKGKTDIFNLETSPLGDIQSVRVRQDESGRYAGWFLDRILIRDDTTGKEFAFPCGQWLAADVGDGQTMRLLKSS